ncbi:MAG: xanthine dehydrogenase family protein molybdopterin-binding subunit [Acidobacteria bacterium]|nr:xanthine dehydrogenase family protein molybdopterin-binding subunit [Acidobacteriota bacterium]
MPRNTTPPQQQMKHDGALSFELDRRAFLKAAGSGLFILIPASSLAALGQARGGQRSYPDDLNAYLRIGENGRVTCYSGKIEMGQANTTALAQMLAEELEVGLDAIDMVMGDTRLCPWDGGTNGSRSIKYFGPALRAAGAEAREVLVQLAAERLKVPASRLAPRDGFVVDRRSSSTRVAYGSLVKGRRIERRLEKKPALKAPGGCKVMGTSPPPSNARDKVTGKAVFAGDVQLAGMLHGRVLRPPVHGAQLKSVDVAPARKHPGARVFQEGNFIAVVHPTTDGAAAALGAIAAEWSTPTATVDDTTILEHLKAHRAESRTVEERGDLVHAEGLSTLTFEGTYFTPYIAHAPIETHSAVAQVSAGEATLWVSTQRPFGVQVEVARAIGLPEERVRVITPLVGGGFGGKSAGPQAVEAARLSKLAGAPVKVVWTREEEFFLDTFRPAAYVTIRSGLNADNRIVSWDFHTRFAGDRSSEMIYDVPHVRTRATGSFGGGGPHPFGTGAWRGPGSNTNIFARESHVDLMAARVGIDPVEFRLRNLADPRLVRVLKAAAGRFRWTSSRAPSGRGQGVALLDYLNTCVAAMAEIAVDAKGSIRVKRVVMAQDMGQAVNPDEARFQMEGCILMGISSVLSEEIHFEGGDVKERNFDGYEITRFSQVPEIETILVDNPELPPQGCGEPAITAMAAVLANALFDATGVRAIRLPLVLPAAR